MTRGGGRVWALLGAFLAAAALLSLLSGEFVTGRAEARLEAAFAAAREAAGAGWVLAEADGFVLRLSGEAPDEAARVAVLALGERIAGPGRVEDGMRLRPPEEEKEAATAEDGRPVLTLTRDGAVLTLAGTLPPGLDRAALAASLPSALRLAGEVAEAADGADGAWQPLFDLALATALALDRAQVAVGPCHLAVTGVAADAATRAAATDGLRAAGHCLARAEILTERPLLTPFPFALHLAPGGAVLEACAAGSAEEAGRIMAALEAAGVAGAACPEALGSPSPDWGRAVLAAVAALREAGAGRVSLRGTLAGFEPADPDAAAPVRERLAAALPRDFTLAPAASASPVADRTPEPALAPAPGTNPAAASPGPGFQAWLARDRSLYLSGLPEAEAEAEAVQSFAAALFGSDRVRAARPEAEGPAGPPAAEGLTARALAGLSALAVLEEGRLHVTAERIALEGRAIAPDAEARARALLSGTDGDIAVSVRFDAIAAAETPPETPEACLRAAERALSEGRIVFAPGSASIEAQSRATLERLAGLMRRCGGTRWEIGGHTDNDGKAEDNLRLSESRAEAVLLALATLGVPLDRLTAKGYGEADPVADNATEAGREANRRIGFRLAEEVPDARK